MFIEKIWKDKHSTPAGVVPYNCNTKGYKHSNPLDLECIPHNVARIRRRSYKLVHLHKNRIKSQDGFQIRKKKVGSRSIQFYSSWLVAISLFHAPLKHFRGG